MDFIIKGLFWIILFVALLFSFNYTISGNLYASEFWDMIGGVLALIASFIFVICLYSAFTVGSFSTHLELSRARRKDWFAEYDSDFL